MKSETLVIEDPKLRSSRFALAIMRIAVAQICGSVGFRASQESALEALTDVAARYLQALAKSAASSANYWGRTQSNLFDVVCALEDLCSIQGFRDAGIVNRAPVTSRTLVDIMKYAEYVDEIPFAKPIRIRRPCSNSSERPAVDCSRICSVTPPHIPMWLPAIPDMSACQNGQKTVTHKEEAFGRVSHRNEKEEEVFGFVSHKNENGNGNGNANVDTSATTVEGETKKMMELPAKRRRIRFSMGVDARRCT